MADNTDVAFQGNPFEDTSDCSRLLKRNDSTTAAVVVFTLENSAKNFRNEKYNRRWMECYPPVVLRRLSSIKAAISCAGVTLANGRGAVGYLTAQLQEITDPGRVTCAVNVVRAALDQATHNFILHREKEERFQRVVSHHEEDACAFHGNFGKLLLGGPRNDLVVNPRGDAYAIVHQYTSDRHPRVMELMHNRYLKPL
jgi:hypothetical protein